MEEENMETSPSLTRAQCYVMKWAGTFWGAGFCSCFPLVYPSTTERDAEQPVSCLMIRGRVKHLLCPFLNNVPTLSKGVVYKHLTFAEAGILASTAGLLLGRWVHIKEAIMPVGRGGRTGNSSCSGSAKFYNSLDECKKKHFIFALKGAKFNSSNTAELL